MSLISHRFKSSASILTACLLASGTSGCLRTRLMVRDGGVHDSTPSTYSAPSSGDGAAASASSSYVIDELKAEIARLSGRVEELERDRSTSSQTQTDAATASVKALEERLVQLEKTQLEILERLKASGFKAPAAAASAEARPTETIQQGARGEFERGKALHAAGKFDEAIEALDSYLKQAPNGRSAEEALFLKGDAKLLTKQYKAAIVDFSKFSDQFPKSKRIPTSLLKIAQSFDALGMATDAKSFYQELLERFPRSPEARKAKARLKG
jgi:tol-pal system protein YbgF